MKHISEKNLKVPRGTIDMEFLEKCPACESYKHKLFCKSQDYLLSSGKYLIHKCESCQLLFTNPRPTAKEIVRHYKSQNYNSHTTSKKTISQKAYFWVQGVMLKRKFKLINKLAKNQNSLLDIGCGIGKFAEYMQNRGYGVSCVEPNENARREAQKRGLDVFQSLAQAKANKVDKVSVITLWHVLEHQHKPGQNLAEYNKTLFDSGLLVVAVPQHDSYDATFYKNHWAALDLPRHLLHFNNQSLIALVRKAGFELEIIKGLPFDSFYVCWLSEKNRKAKIGLVRALFVAFWSNIMAIIGARPWSSQIFVFKKMHPYNNQTVK